MSVTSFADNQPRHLIPGLNKGGPAIQTRGVMGCYVIERREVPAMMYAADGGDHTAAQVRIGIGLWMQKAFAPGTPTQHCVICHTYAFKSASDPEAFFLAIPMRGDGDSMVSAVCTRCTRRVGSDGLLAAAIEYHKRVWPAARVTGTAVAGLANPRG